MPDVESLIREANQLWRSTFPTDAAVSEQSATLAPAAEVHETESALSIQLDLPGHNEKEIQVRVEGDTLTIQSERKQEHEVGKNATVRSERAYGMFARSFVLPDSVDANAGDAQYKNGVLTLSFPKREEAKPKTISIRVQS